MGEEREPAPAEEPSVNDRLEEWREAERDAELEEPDSAARAMARHRAEMARDVFHEREDEEHDDYDDPLPRRPRNDTGEPQP